MSVQRCFRAAERLSYDAGGSGPYNGYLLTPPRIYGEELACFQGSTRLGVIYVVQSPNNFGPNVINLFAPTVQVAYPGWATARWRFDGQYGRLLGRDHYVLSFGPGSVFYDLLSVEPAHLSPLGAIWWFGVHADAYHGGAMLLDWATFEPDTSTVIRTDSFLDPRGDTPNQMMDFAVDRNSDRAFVRWDTNNTGQISVYRLSTREYLFDIWTPNASCGITLTSDGFIYAVDSADWLLVYSYEGAFQGICKNPRRAEFTGAGGGFAYGWDQMYKRLLFAGAIDNGSDGHCRVRILGLYPVPDVQIVSPPIPRQVPRNGRRVHLVSRVVGEGAEPIASRIASVTGAGASGNYASDRDGDVVFPWTPSVTGLQTVSVEVNADPTPADLTEP